MGQACPETLLSPNYANSRGQANGFCPPEQARLLSPDRRQTHAKCTDSVCKKNFNCTYTSLLRGSFSPGSGKNHQKYGQMEDVRFCSRDESR